jgi:hypothetical protein
MSRSANTLSALKSDPGLLGQREYDGRFVRVGRRRAADDEKPGDVVLVVLHGLLQHVETEDFGRAA